MKKLALLCLFMGSIQMTNAQFNFDNLFGGASIGYASPVGDFSDFAKGGFTYNIDVGYKLTEQLGVGVSYISTITAGIDDSLATGVLGINFYGLNSYLAKGWYRFQEGTFSPYVSVGLGLASVSEPDVTINNETIEGESSFGFGASLEAGLTIQDFLISYSFNLAGKSPGSAAINGGEGLSVNYHRFTVGYLYNF